MRARIWGSLLLAVWCAGCAAQPALPLVNAVAPGQARITITREALPGPPVIIDDINGGHVVEMPAALIDVNDAHVADLQPGQTYVGGVPPGPTSVTATGTAEPGHYVVKFSAVAGKTYAFQVAPRTDATRKVASEVNKISEAVNEWVYEQTRALLIAGKMPVVLGGDHSVPFGAMLAYAETQGIARRNLVVDVDAVHLM